MFSEKIIFTYKKHIKEAGKYTVLQMEEEVMTEFERIWQKNGLGWFCEKAIDEYGQVVLLAYNGSSSYNTKQMTRLIDSVIQDCKEQQIETMTPEKVWNRDNHSCIICGKYVDKSYANAHFIKRSQRWSRHRRKYSHIVPRMSL